MKLGFAALILALSSVIAQPIANGENHLENRAVKINKNQIRQAIRTNQSIMSQQQALANKLQSVASSLGGMSGKGIQAAIRSQRTAADTQRKAASATANVIRGLQRLV